MGRRYKATVVIGAGEEGGEWMAVVREVGGWGDVWEVGAVDLVMGRKRGGGGDKEEAPGDAGANKRDGPRPSAELSPGAPGDPAVAWRGGSLGLRFGACCSLRPQQPTALCIFAVGQAGCLPGA